METDERLTQPWPKSPDRILVMRGGALGDFILTLPALAALRARFPSAHITLAGRSEATVFALSSGYVDQISELERSEYAALYSSRPPQEPHFSTYDLIVSWLADSDGCIGQNLAAMGVHAVLIAPTFPVRDTPCHMADYFVRTLEQLGVNVADGHVPRITLTQQSRDLAERFWDKQGLRQDDYRPVVAIHPGSGGRFKLWPTRRFADLALVLVRERAARLLVVGGPADEDTLNELQSALFNADFVMVREQRVADLAALLARCAVFVGNDSGVTHLAAAVGTPTVAVFGPTDPLLWGPRGAAVAIVRGACENAPCGLERGRACLDRRCLQTLPTEAVSDAALAYLPR